MLKMCNMVFAKLNDHGYDQTKSNPYLLGSQSDSQCPSGMGCPPAADSIEPKQTDKKYDYKNILKI